MTRKEILKAIQVGQKIENKPRNLKDVPLDLEWHIKYPRENTFLPDKFFGEIILAWGTTPSYIEPREVEVFGLPWLLSFDDELGVIAQLKGGGKYFEAPTSVHQELVLGSGGHSAGAEYQKQIKRILIEKESAVLPNGTLIHLGIEFSVEYDHPWSNGGSCTAIISREFKIGLLVTEAGRGQYASCQRGVEISTQKGLRILRKHDKKLNQLYSCKYPKIACSL